MSNLIDAEMRVVFPEARNKSFCIENKEVQLHKTIYSHKKIRISLKQATVEHLLNIMTNYKIKSAIISGLNWQNLKNLKLNNNYLRYCINKYPKKLKIFYNVNFVSQDLYLESLKLINSKLDKNVLGIEFHHSSFFKIHHPKNKKRFLNLCKIIKKKNKYIRFIGRYPSQHKINLINIYISLIKKLNYKKIIFTSLGGGIENYFLKNIKKINFKPIFLTSASKSLQTLNKSWKICPKNIVYASDYPFNIFETYKSFFNTFNKLKIPLKYKSIIKYKNAKQKFF